VAVAAAKKEQQRPAELSMAAVPVAWQESR